MDNQEAVTDLENQTIEEFNPIAVSYNYVIEDERADSLFIVENSNGYLCRLGGYTLFLIDALRYTGKQVKDLEIPSGNMFYLVKNGNSYLEKPAAEPAPAADGAPVRKSKMSDHFNMGFIAMLQAAPKNQGLRAHIMKSLLQMPPDEIVTYAALQDWVEFNFEAKPKPHKAYGKKSDGPSLELGFTSNERERGRCDYSRDVNGNGTYCFTVDDLRGLIEDDSLGIEGVLIELAQMARENCDFDYEYEEEEISDHESNDSDGQTVRHERPSMAADEVRNFLEANAPELLELLDGNTD